MFLCWTVGAFFFYKGFGIRIKIQAYTEHHETYSLEDTRISNLQFISGDRICLKLYGKKKKNNL